MKPEGEKIEEMEAEGGAGGTSESLEGAELVVRLDGELKMADLLLFPLQSTSACFGAVHFNEFHTFLKAYCVVIQTVL